MFKHGVTLWRVALVFLIFASPGFTPVLHAEEVPSAHRLITVPQAIVLGLVEGITEYLPISSTGHLILVDEFLGMKDTEQLSTEQLDAIGAFEIVIQGGAILAVVLLYLGHLKFMMLGLLGKSSAGRQLLFNVVAGFIPTAVIGLALNKIIKHYLMFAEPVMITLFVGGVLMILFERTRWAKESRMHGKGLESLSVRQAVCIGFGQCLALIPGTSRSMVTIMTGIGLGLSPVAAAEFSFLLGLPTLLAATLYKVKKEGHLLMSYINHGSMIVGAAVAAITAIIAVQGFVKFLNRRGLAPFGWYRIALAVVVLAVLRLRSTPLG